MCCGTNLSTLDQILKIWETVMFSCQQIHLTDTGVCFLCMVSCVNLIIFYSVLQRIDIVQQLTGIPFESVVAVSGVVCSRPPAQENMVCRIVCEIVAMRELLHVEEIWL